MQGLQRNHVKSIRATEIGIMELVATSQTLELEVLHQYDP